MRSEWFDAASALGAFTQAATAPVEDVMRFKHLLVRLFSMLHSAALAGLEQGRDEDHNGVAALHYEIIDPEAVDSITLSTLKHSNEKVEQIFYWIQMFVVKNIGTGVLAIPPPILSRSFQELANGMIAFHNAKKITYIQFPFPYAQICDCLLVMHWLIVPLVTSQWTTNPIWAGVFCFIQVFILWSLNMIAAEIEDPFGTDPNDLDGDRMQAEMNMHLRLLLDQRSNRLPKLSGNFSLEEAAGGGAGGGGSKRRASCLHQVFMSDCKATQDLSEIHMDAISEHSEGDEDDQRHGFFQRHAG
jgi:hypothetical protein